MDSLCLRSMHRWIPVLLAALASTHAATSMADDGAVQADSLALRVQPQMATLRPAAEDLSVPKLDLSVEVGGVAIPGRAEREDIYRPDPGVQVDYRAWAGSGPTKLGIGVSAIARPSWAQGMHSTLVLPPVASSQAARDGPTPVVALRYTLASGSNISVDYQPLTLARMLSGDRPAEQQIGLQFRSNGSPLLGALNSRSLRMNLDSASYIALRASRRGVSLQYRATF